MPLIPALGRQWQGDLCEFEVSLVYRARTVTQRKPVSKKPNKKEDGMAGHAQRQKGQ